MTKLFERIRAGEVVRAAFNVPRRHWKSVTIHHGIVWLQLSIPGIRIAYFTYRDKAALRHSRAAQRVAKAAGILNGKGRVTDEEWECDNGSVFRCGGLIGGATGEGFDVIIIDDPYRRREDAESMYVSDRTRESFDADIFMLQQNKPTSFLIVHSRWTTHDLTAHVTAADYQGGHPFESLNIPAINERGEPLFPKYWPLSRLEPLQWDKYEWTSQYMGQPVALGGNVFEQPMTCALSAVPATGVDAIGIDLAYSAKTHADYSVIVVLRKVGETYYVVDVVRRQDKAEDFAPALAMLALRFRGTRIRWHCTGPEVAVAQLVGKLASVTIDAVPTQSDKRVRALPLSAVWNDRRVIVPRDAPWSAAFVAEMCAFTGVADKHDDQVDACASAFSLLTAGAIRNEYSGGRTSRMRGARVVF